MLFVYGCDSPLQSFKVRFVLAANKTKRWSEIKLKIRPLDANTHKNLGPINHFYNSLVRRFGLACLYVCPYTFGVTYLLLGFGELVHASPEGGRNVNGNAAVAMQRVWTGNKTFNPLGLSNFTV